LVHPSPEGGNFFFFNGEARSQLVAAKAQKQVAAFLQRGKEIEAPPAAAGALSRVAGNMDHKAGAGVFLAEAGGHDAHHALVPLMVSQDQGVPLLRRHLLDHGNGLGIDLMLHGLPLAV